jgi:hypothetical protein
LWTIHVASLPFLVVVWHAIRGVAAQLSGHSSSCVSQVRASLPTRRVAYYELAGLAKLPPGDERTALAERLTATIRGSAELPIRPRMAPGGLSG